MNKSAENNGDNKPRSMMKEGIILSIINSFGKVSGFIRGWFLAYFLGTGIVADAFRIAVDFVVSFYTLIVGTQVEVNWIPQLLQYRKRQKKHLESVLTWSIFIIATVLSIVSAIVVYFFAPQIVTLQAPSFVGQDAETTIAMLRWFTPVIPLYIISFLFIYLLNSHLRFRIAGLFNTIINLFVIIIIYVVIKFNLPTVFLGLSYTLSLIFLVVIFLYNIYKDLPPVVRMSKARLKTVLLPFLKNYWPILVMTLFFPLRLFVDKLVASSVSIGSIAALGYARLFLEAPVKTLGEASMRIVLPTYSKMVAENKIDEVGEHIFKLINITLLVMLPGSILYAASGESMIKIVLGYGAFNEEAVKLTAMVLMGYSLNLWNKVINPSIARVYFAQSKNLLLATLNSSSSILTITLCLILGYRFGLVGIALATTISEFGLTLVMLPKLPGKVALRSLKSILFWYSMAVVVYFIVQLIPDPAKALYDFILDGFSILLIWGLIAFIVPSSRANIMLILSKILKR